MSNKEGIKSLMQYRYIPKSSSGTPSPKKMPLVPRPKVELKKKSPAKEAVVVPDTPEKQWPSPVSKDKKIAGSNKAIIIDSDDEDSSQKSVISSNVKSPKVTSSTSSSPWLNKSVGEIKFNGKSHSQSTTSSLQSSKESRNTSPSSAADDSWRKRLENVNQLKAAFPNHDPDFLEKMWDTHQDYEESVTAIIANIGNGGKKRPAPDDESPVKAPQKKRMRIISESSNDEPPTPEPTSNTNRLREISITQMMASFPDKSRKDCIEVLEKTKYNLHKARRMMSNETGHVPSQTPTSIKNQKSRIKQIQREETITIESDDSSDVEIVNEDVIEAESDDSESDYDSDAEPADEKVLEFFNNTTVDECAVMPGCSRKKAEVIIELQPFKNWSDLTTKFRNSKFITPSLIPNCKEALATREAVTSLMKKCKKISSQIQGLVSRLTSGTTIDTDGHITRQPRLMNEELQLKPYQMVGLNWLVLLHGQELNGILADEMGLGKTVQAISLLAHLLGEGEKGPHIIVVPCSTIDNWLRELRRWCPSLEVVLYYGSQEERRALRYQLVDEQMEFNVLITTYNMTYGTPEDRNLFKRYDFVYAIFDEAHMLKNMASQRYGSLMRTKAKRRLLLTGTPLQNNLVELMSLLAFVMPTMFTSKADHLKRMFTTLTKGDGPSGTYEKDRIEQAKNIMKPFVLRRLKIHVLSQLPKKIDNVRKCPMTEAQKIGYDKCVDKIKRRLADTEDTTRNANYLMELRKWSNHPLLQRSLYTDEKLRFLAKAMMRDPDHLEANEQFIFEDMEVMSDFEVSNTCKIYPCIREHVLGVDTICQSGKFLMLDQMLPEMLEKADRVLLFSQFTMVLDVIEVYMKKRGYKFLRLDGQTPVIERQDLIDKYNNDPSIFIFLLSTRAGGLGINLTSANTVIMHDIDFNPYNDKQAEDRCHRVGQTRDVTVYRLVSEDTIEEDILATAQRKLQLEQDITGEQAGDKENPSDVASLLRKALRINKYQHHHHK